ncbi:MAG: acyltransferase family protein [Anaerolineales bacterium]|nr:acyltransferase family protein [Anaerolineales bacterium]
MEAEAKPLDLGDVAASPRLHALDGLRAAALLTGVVFHALFAYVMRPGEWAVGTNEPNLWLGWFVHYTHAFRMQLFFLLAGFFAARVVARRGAGAYVRDRVIRIGLVFVVLLYPMKLLINIAWIGAGLASGGLSVASDAAQLSLAAEAIDAIRTEVWPDIRLFHLWFLYILLILSVGFVAVRWAAYRWLPRLSAVIGKAAMRVGSAVCASRLAPLWLALPVLPILARTPRAVLDAPDRGFALEPYALIVYGLSFLLGWVLSRDPKLLRVLAQRGRVFLLLSLVTGSLGFGLDIQRVAGMGLPETHLLAAFANALTLSLAGLGWIGFFFATFSRPSRVMRYLADSSYWVYLAHLPLVVALQGWTADWPLVLGLTTNLAVTFGAALSSYHWLVRATPFGSWLNGRARSL